MEYYWKSIEILVKFYWKVIEILLKFLLKSYWVDDSGQCVCFSLLLDNDHRKQWAESSTQ